MLFFGCNIVQYVGLFMFLTRCHAFPFPATRGHLPRGATFAPNRRWPLVAGTTVLPYARLNFTTRCMRLPKRARWLSGRTPDSQSRNPWLESPVLPFRSLGIFAISMTPQFGQFEKHNATCYFQAGTFFQLSCSSSIVLFLFSILQPII